MARLAARGPRQACRPAAQELDGSKNEWGWSKSKLGANAILAVSMAACKAGAPILHRAATALHRSCTAAAPQLHRSRTAAAPRAPRPSASLTLTLNTSPSPNPNPDPDPNPIPNPNPTPIPH